MDFFFKPQAIAVVGATPNPFKGGCSILINLITGFKGRIYPVNPRYEAIEGLRCYPSVCAVEGPVDLAIVFVPAPATPDAVADCIRKGVRGIIIESGGFAETGAEGRLLQQEILAMTRSASVRIWGPNCMGIVDAISGSAFSFLDPRALKAGFIPGNVSLVVQSGMLSAGFLVDIMTHGIMGISKVCSVGNKIDVDECDLLPWLLADEHTSVIGLYLETIADGRNFVNICRNSKKPIVVLKGGKSSKGAAAAMSHTASLAGNHRIVSGALAQAGVIEASDFKQMMDICRSLATVPKPYAAAKGGVAILTFSGGAGIVSADFLDEMGIKVSEFSQETNKRLKAFFPHWMPVANPVDLWPAIEKNAGGEFDAYSEALQAVLADPAVEAVLMHVFVGNFRIRVSLPDIAKLSRAAGKPVFIWLLGRREEAYAFQQQAREYGVLVFQELRRAVECLSTVMSRNKRGDDVHAATDTSLSAISPLDLPAISASTKGALDEFISKKIIKAYGIETVEESKCLNWDECLHAAAQIGYPVVMKGIQQGIVHKTEHGLVIVDIRNKSSLRQAFRTLKQRMKGDGFILVQKYTKGHVELILGMLRDEQFGVCVMAGMGGIMAEVFQDAAFATAPLQRREALELIDRLRGRKLLDGFRGHPPANLTKIADMLTALGNIGLDCPQIKEIDINPLMVTASGAVAVDATVVVA